MQNFELFLLISGIVIIVGFFAVALYTARRSDEKAEETMPQSTTEPTVSADLTPAPDVTVQSIEPVIVSTAQAEPKTLKEEFTPAPQMPPKLNVPDVESRDQEQAAFADEDIAQTQHHSSAGENEEPKPAGESSFGNGDWMKIIRKTFKQRVDHNHHQIQAHEQQMGGLIIINVMAHRGVSFYGGDVFEVLNRLGLRFGELGIFHKFDAKGRKLFSVSSAIEPGYFDINNMNLMSTPGLTCFFDLDEVENPKYSYRTLLATAHELAHFLGAEIFDQNHQPLNQSSIQGALQRIKTLDAKRIPVNAD